MRATVPPGCLSLVLLAGLLVVLPLFLADAMLTALGKLGLSPAVSFWVAIGIFAGGAINIPVKRIPREETLEVPMVQLFGIGRFVPRTVTRRTYTTIAVNVDAVRRTSRWD